MEQNKPSLVIHKSGLVEIIFNTETRWHNYALTKDYYAGGEPYTTLRLYVYKDEEPVNEFDVIEEQYINTYMDLRKYHYFEEQEKDQIILTYIPYSLYD